MIALLLLACEPEAEAQDSAPVAEEPACGDWASVGEPFVLNWCTSCHSSGLPEGQRYGAPLAVNVDSLEAVQAQGALLSAVATGEAPSMPPGGGVPAAEREVFARWLACGAPGTPRNVPVGQHDATLLGGDILVGAYSEVGASAAELRFDTGTLGDFVLDLRLAGDGAVALGSYFVFDPEGLPLGEATFDPPLPLWPESQAGEQLTTVLSEWAGVEGNGQEQWELSFTPEAEPDPRFATLLATRLSLLSDSGAQFELWLSQEHGLLAADFVWGLDSEGRVDRLLMATAKPPFDRGSDFPLQLGDGFSVRRTLWQEPAR